MFPRLLKLLDDRPCGITAALPAYAAAVVAVVLAAFFVGPTVTNTCTIDTLFHLNVGHRLWEGCRPYVDFHVGHGPLAFIFVALGISAAGVSVEAIWIGQLLAAFLLGSLCFYVASRRLSPFWTALLALNATALLVMPTPLSYKVWREFSHAMWYNNVSFVLLGILAISLLIPLRGATRRGRILASMIDGTVLALLGVTKLSFFVMALGFYLVAKLVWPQRDEDRRWECVAAIGVMGLMFFAVLAACHTSFAAYLAAIRVHGLQFDVPLVLLLGHYLQFTDIIFYVVMVFALIYGAGFQSGGKISPLVRSAVVSAVAVGCFLASTTTCRQECNVVPFLGVVPLAAVLCVRRRAIAPTRNTLALSVAVLGTLLLLLTQVKDCALSYLFLLKRPPTLTQTTLGGRPPQAGEPVECPFKDAGVSRCFRHIEDPAAKSHVLSALSLLKECGCAEGDTLYVCDVVDSVTMFSHCRYPKGVKGVYAWQLYITPATEAALKELYTDDFLADTKWILRSESDLWVWDRLQRAQGEYLAAHFHEAGKKGGWTLYRRR